MAREKPLHEAMHVNTLLTNEDFTLLAKSLGMMLLATCAGDLLVVRHLSQHLLHVCVIAEMELVGEARYPILGELCWATTHGTFHYLNISMRKARKFVQAILAECMQARKGLGLGEVMEANGAVQLFLYYFKDIRHGRDLLSHDRQQRRAAAFV